jgi:putative addiction module killer protein
VAEHVAGPPGGGARRGTSPSARAREPRRRQDGLSELRIDYGPGYRVYFVRRATVLIVVLCSGDKSSQDRDIARAKVLAKEIDDAP